MKSPAKTLVASVAVFACCFAATLMTRSAGDSEPAAPRTPIAALLDLDPAQEAAIDALDPAFTEDRDRLHDDLDRARLDLAAAFEQADPADADLRAKLEAVIEAHNGLERRVAEHIMTVHHHLNAEQRKKLFGLCAATIREGQKQMRWRHGQNRSGAPGHGDGSGDGSGPVRDHGRGRRSAEGPPREPAQGK